MHFCVDDSTHICAISLIFDQDQKHDQDMEQMKRPHEQQITELKKAHEAAVRSGDTERATMLDTMTQLKQQLIDRDADAMAADRKNTAIVRDMKRQMALEKKRADKLEERLVQLIAINTPHLQVNASDKRGDSPGSFEEMGHETVAKEEEGSISSWQLVHESANQTKQPLSSRHSRNSSNATSVTGGDVKSPPLPPPTTDGVQLDGDICEMIGKVTELQREKYELLDRVRALESSNAVSAEQLQQKSTIIEQYVRERKHIGGEHVDTTGRIDQRIRKAVEIVRQDIGASGDLRSMNRRLQVMLEETLMKNLHLQNDVNVMSQELAHLKTVEQSN